MMRLVVSHADGTGKFAEARGYMVGGKTGTAEKIQAGGYNKKPILPHLWPHSQHTNLAT